MDAHPGGGVKGATREGGAGAKVGRGLEREGRGLVRRAGPGRVKLLWQSVQSGRRTAESERVLEDLTSIFF